MISLRELILIHPFSKLSALSFFIDKHSLKYQQWLCYCSIKRPIPTAATPQQYPLTRPPHFEPVYGQKRLPRGKTAFRCLGQGVLRGSSENRTPHSKILIGKKIEVGLYPFLAFLS